MNGLKQVGCSIGKVRNIIKERTFLEHSVYIFILVVIEILLPKHQFMYQLLKQYLSVKMMINANSLSGLCDFDIYHLILIIFLVDRLTQMNYFKGFPKIPNTSVIHLGLRKKYFQEKKQKKQS